MDWASHGTLSSRLAPHIQVVLMPSKSSDESANCRLSEIQEVFKGPRVHGSTGPRVHG